MMSGVRCQLEALSDVCLIRLEKKSEVEIRRLRPDLGDDYALPRKETRTW